MICWDFQSCFSDLRTFDLILTSCSSQLNLTSPPKNYSLYSLDAHPSDSTYSATVVRSANPTTSDDAPDAVARPVPFAGSSHLHSVLAAGYADRTHSDSMTVAAVISDVPGWYRDFHDDSTDSNENNDRMLAVYSMIAYACHKHLDDLTRWLPLAESFLHHIHRMRSFSNRLTDPNILMLAAIEALNHNNRLMCNHHVHMNVFDLQK